MSIRATLTNLFLRYKVKPKPGTPIDVEQVRKRMDKLVDPPRAVPSDVVHKPVPAQPDKQLCAAEWLTSEAPQRTVLYFHGGGYFFCSLATHRPLCSFLSQVAKARVLSVDYRMAPEHACPAAVDDALAWYRELLQSTPAEEIVIAGDSAGGGLALACVLAARDAGLPMPAGVTLYSPWVDLSCSGESMQTLAQAEVIFDAGSMRPCAELYLQGRDPEDPQASPLFADLKGLPPLQIFASNHEIMLSDSTRLHEKAQAAGVNSTLQLRDKLPHAWPLILYLPEAQRSLQQTAEFMQEHAPAKT